MSYVVSMMPRAARQLNLIALWWRANRPEAPELATDEVLAAMASLTQNPARGIRVSSPRGQHRRMLVMVRSKLLVVYRILPRAHRVEIQRIKRP